MPKRYRIKASLDEAMKCDCYGIGREFFAALVGKRFSESDITKRVKEYHSSYGDQADALGTEDWLVLSWWIPSGWIEEIN